MASDEKIKGDSKLRVKLYVLNETRSWDDRGTGHVMCVPDANATALVVRSETEPDTILLDSKIQLDTAYQKQQETLIVWSENENCDLALSFQEKTGCEEIWEKICSVQGKDPTQDITQEVQYEEEGDNDTSGEGMQSSQGNSALAGIVNLPTCELGKLREMLDLINSCLNNPLRRESLALNMETDGYIPKLLDLFRMCEDLENKDSLKLIYQIVKSIFMLNKNALLEIMFSEDHLKEVVGALEYDPSLVETKKHREFLWSEAAFKEVIPIPSADLRAKIHQTYRVQYIQDAVLPAPSIFEENMLSSLSSFIFFNRVEIVALIQDNEEFLSDLFGQLKNEETAVSKRKDLTLFLKEFCTFAQSLQPQGPQSKDAFFKTLCSHGILEAIEMCLKSSDDTTRAAATEIFAMLVDYSPPMAREYMLEQCKKYNSSDQKLLINVVIDQLFCDTDPELSSAMQLLNVLRILVDPENMMAAAAKSEKAEFLAFFYKRAMAHLCRPLMENTIGRSPRCDDYYTANRLSLIVDMLCFCIEHHSFHVRNFVISKEILRRVLVLLKSKHAFLALGALRLFRRVIQLKDEFYYRHIVKLGLLESVVNCFHSNGNRYNLLNSALLELFEFIRAEEIKTLIVDFVENFVDQFENVNYVNTFAVLKSRYENYRERESNRMSSPMVVGSSEIPDRNIPTPPPIWRRQTRMSKEEETWFEEDEEWETLPTSPVSSGVVDSLNFKSQSPPDEFVPTLQRTKAVPIGPSSQKYEQFPSVLKKREEEDSSVFGNSPRPIITRPNMKITIKTPLMTQSDQTQTGNGNEETDPILPQTKVSLVAYDLGDSDSDDDENEGNEKSPVKKRLKLD